MSSLHKTHPNIQKLNYGNVTGGPAVLPRAEVSRERHATTTEKRANKSATNRHVQNLTTSSGSKIAEINYIKAIEATLEASKHSSQQKSKSSSHYTIFE